MALRWADLGRYLDKASSRRRSRQPLIYQRPNGGFSLTALPASHLVGRAYALAFLDDIVGLPDWAKSEPCDVSATSSLSRVTTEERLAMV